MDDGAHVVGVDVVVDVVLDRRVRRLDGGRVLLGGDPGRLVRLRSREALAAVLDRKSVV